MSCVTSVSSSLLFNGGRLEAFTPSRGIRQGDPLSPYLFILCMEYLGHLIEGKCTTKDWNPVKASRSGPPFSHLFFADDLVLFATADVDNCSTINSVLQEFCSKSGLKVSVNKSRVFFSPNVEPDLKDCLSNLLGFSSTSNLGKYLGFPLLHPGTRRHDFDFVLDRVKTKLAGWKANLLSMAGRVVLIQASSSAIPSYVMQNSILPNRILNGVDRVNRNFLWGSTDQVKKMHWVNWGEVTKTKEVGGLGLQSAKGRNTVLLAKLNWRFCAEKDAMWAKVLRLKYCTHQRINSRNTSSLSKSPTWKGITKGNDVFNQGVKWVPGLDSNLSFWSDFWLDSGPIRASIQGPLTLDSSNLKIKEVRTASGWNWARLPFVFPSDLKKAIQAVPIPLVSRTSDKMAWKYSPKGGFDMRSAYLLTDSRLRDEAFSGKWIWSVHTLPRIQFFIWRCMHNSIGVRETLARRGIAVDTTCPLCNIAAESAAHALRDCHVVKALWYQLGVCQSNSNFFTQDLRSWLKSNATAKSNQSQRGLHWNTLFPFAIWLIWKHRNQVVFKNRGANPTLANMIIMQATEFFHCVSCQRNNRRLVIKQVRWERPGEGWLKLNTDGVANAMMNSAGAGGVVRDDRGTWVVRFSRRIGNTNSFAAEA